MLLTDSLIIALGLLVGGGIQVAADRYAGLVRAPRALPLVASALAGGLVALAACLFSKDDPGLLAFSLLFGWALLALAVIDLQTFLLPDLLNLSVFLLGCGMVALYRQDVWMWHVAGAAVGYGLLWLVETGYRRLRGVDGLGRGDAKLLGAIGMWVGLMGISPVLLIASLSGILVAVSQSVIRRTSLSGQSMIAFGPSIALGGFVVWLTWPAPWL